MERAFFNGFDSAAPIEQLTKTAPPAGEKEEGGKPFVVRRLPLKPGMNSDVFTLDEGEAVLQWPTRMSPESYEDFKDWLDLIMRKAKRAVKETEASES